MESPDDQLVTICEAALIVGANWKTVGGWVERGLLQSRARRRGKGHASGRLLRLVRLGDVRHLHTVCRAPGDVVAPEGFMSCCEAAVALDLSYQTITKMARDGRLESTKVPYSPKASVIFISRDHVERLLRKAAAPPEPEPVAVARPLICGNDTICLAARRAKFEADGRKFSSGRIAG